MAIREITGKHVLLGFVGAFTVIVGVNVYMAYSAVSTFPGLEVENGYIASQTFNERKAEQESLGWHVTAEEDHGTLHLGFADKAGQPVHPARIEATVGRPTEDFEDKVPEFTYNGRTYEAPMQLGQGKWILRLKAYSLDGILFQQRREIVIDRS